MDKLIIKSSDTQLSLTPPTITADDKRHGITKPSIFARIRRKGEAGESLTELDPGIVRCIAENATEILEWLPPPG